MTGSDLIDIAALRLHHLEAAVGDVDVSPLEAISIPGPLIGITSSRLGHDCLLHRRVCRFLTHSIRQCRQRGGTLLVAAGSAIEPWALRAAELFSVPVQVLSVEGVDRGDPQRLVVRPPCGQDLSRDAVLISLADRVDAVFVRQGGKVERSLKNRVCDRNDASTRVAVSMTKMCAAPGLIANGAVGWFVAQANTTDPPITSDLGRSTELSRSSDSWTRTDGAWLIHCTRGSHGPWPGETERQYRDSMLLGDRASAKRGPLESLGRIVRSGRLIAGGSATRKSHPVVCFSALPLRELLDRRCFRPHLGRWDYEPYGIAIRSNAAQRVGVRPVIYGQPGDRRTLAPADQFRFHPVGKTYDWRSEREWRSPRTIDLTKLDVRDVRVFVNDFCDAAQLPVHCRWSVTTLGTQEGSTPGGVHRE